MNTLNTIVPSSSSATTTRDVSYEPVAEPIPLQIRARREADPNPYSKITPATITLKLN
uniref:Uncharacterized protein n=1 Tax=Arundo donax TaxID=35708 RepID=A0A0A9AI34_ARUDO